MSTTATKVQLGSVRNALDDWFDGREDGCYLVGYVQDDEIVVLRAVAFAEDEDRGPTRVSLNLKKALQILQDLPSGLTLVGEAHCHPKGESAVPSMRDLETFQGMADYMNRDWLAITVSNRPVKIPGIYGRDRDSDRLDLIATLVSRHGGRFEFSALEES